MENIQYLIGFGGGIGPDTWDDEIVIDAEGIDLALARAMVEMRS